MSGEELHKFRIMACGSPIASKSERTASESFIFAANACESISQNMRANAARSVFVLSWGQRDKLGQKLRAVSILKMSDVLGSDFLFAHPTNKLQGLFDCNNQ